MIERYCSLERNSGKKAMVARNGFNFLASSLLLLAMVLVSFSTALAQVEYEASEVDSKPKIIQQTRITYPSMAKKNNVEGRVVVNVLIGTNGKASKMEIVESEPEGVFDENAMKSLKNWKFRPGIKGGELVPTWVKIPLSFKLDD
jgi:protein TonB